MSAVNAIIRRAIFVSAVLLAGVGLVAPGQVFAGKSVSAIGSTSSLAVKLNRLTREAAPAAARDTTNGNNGITRLDVVSVIGTNELGDGMRMPTAVFCDLKTDETYVVDGGLISVYGDNYFPVASLGRGRGIETATGVYVDKQGNVYVPQARYYDEPSRITIYNAAFFQIGQIYLDEIPGVGDANPKSLVINDAGEMYIAFGSSGLRGVLVLDRDGNYSHWLRPLDLIFDQAVIEQYRRDSENEEDVAEDEDAPLFDIAELVPNLAPADSEQEFKVEDEPGLGPVQILDVARDANGNLYLLSAETGKVYIYTPAEEFLYSFGEQGGSTGKLSQPRKLVVDEKKKAIYIVDYNRHAVLIYDLSGRFMHEFGGKGNRPGWFQYPSSLATTRDGNVVVADMFNRRVQVLDVHFQYKFPLFQVPFVFNPNERLNQPMPMETTENKYYGPGFEEGRQASVETEQMRSIKALLEEAEGVI